MYTKKIKDFIEGDLQAIKDNGKFKTERLIEGAQGSHVIVDGKEMVMFASNNYLGLANHPMLIESAKDGMDKFGFGTASVRFLSGTQTLHRELEERIAKFIGIEKHPQKPHQRYMIFEYKKYIWLVPYVVYEGNYFLKTAFPSRKHTKKYLGGK